MIRAADGAVLAGSTALSGGRYTRRYPTGQPVRAAGRLRQHPVRARRPRDASTTTRSSAARRSSAACIDSIVEQGPGRRQPADDARPEGPEGRHTTRSRATTAPSSRSTSRPARCACWPARRRSTRPTRARRAPRPSTTPPRASIRPGSTFKTVTATAAIDSGKYQPDSRVSGKNGKVISGTPLNNFGSENFGDITLTDALTHSVNTVWAEVGVKLGRTTMQEYMDRFGFGEEAADGLSRRPDGRSSGPRRKGEDPADELRAASTSGAPRSARRCCWSRRCRWRPSPRRSATAACGWSRGWWRRSSIPTAARSTSRCPRRPSA